MSTYLHHRSRRTILLASFVVLVSSTAVAASPGISNFNIPAEDLATALAAFSKVTAIQASAPGYATTNVPGVQGNLTPEEALSALLAGTGLSGHFVAPDQVVVSAARPIAGSVIGTVRVQAAGQAAQTSPTYGPHIGANGSSDPDATEGTGSYTSNGLTIGSKASLSIRETPQSVSVITSQQIQDQQLNSLTDVLNQAAGVTVAQGVSGSSLQPTYYSRGYEINTFQIDGGAPISYGGSSNLGSGANNGNLVANLVPNFDSSEFDRVELVQGADGEFVGTGNPGGVISMQRKRPVDGVQLNADAGIGSYDHHRFMLDGSSPLFNNDKVRLRVVATQDNQSYFYKSAYTHQDSIYENLEVDPFAGTQINIGSDYSYESARPDGLGLPRYTTGANINLPTDTCLCADGSHESVRSLEYFAELHQQLAQNWNLQLNLSGLQQQTAGLIEDVYGPYNGITQSNPYPSSGTGEYLTANPVNYASKQYSADGTVVGKFEVLGHEQSLTLGANYSYLVNANANDALQDGPVSFANYDGSPGYGVILENIFNFSPSAPTGPVVFSPQFEITAKQNQAQYGAYAMLRLSPWQPLHLTIGERYSVYDTENVSNYVSYPLPPARSTVSEHTILPPYIGLTLDVLQHMTLFGSYTDIYNSQAIDLTRSGTPLGPETGTSYEAGIKRSDFNDTLNTSISVYYSKQINLAVQVPGYDPACFAGGQQGCFYNAGESQTSEGIDLQINGAVTPQLQITGSYSYNENRFDPGAAQYVTQAPLVTIAPKHLAKLFVTYQLGGAPWLERTEIGLGVHAQSTTYISGYNYGTGSDVNFYQGGYAVFDAFAKYKINPHLSAQLNLTNIFNRTYYQTVGGVTSGNYYGPPQSFLFTLHASL